MVCSSCKIDKAESEFNWRNKRLGERQGYCRDCKRRYQRRYYEANKVTYRATSEISKRRRREVAMIRLKSILSDSGCVDCGETDFRCLQFDHVRGVKVKEVSRLLWDGVKWDTIEKEIAKCEVRCANCHWKVTATRANWYAYMHLSSSQV